VSNDLSIPLGIREAIEKDHLVFFIGSGMSQQFGFPGWRQLIQYFKSIKRRRC